MALAAALAVSTGGTGALFFRYLAGLSGLGSLVQAAVAIARGRPFTERFGMGRGHRARHDVRWGASDRRSSRQGYMR